MSENIITTGEGDNDAGKRADERNPQIDNAKDLDIDADI